MDVQPADAIIILGRGIKPDGTLPKIAQARGQLGYELFKNNLAPAVLVSSKYWGFQNFVPPITEAAAMKQYIKQLGVSENIITEQNISEDTIGEAFFNKKITDDKNWHKLIIVTSTDHLDRVQIIFNHIFEPNYALQFATADSELTDNELTKTMRLEQRACKIAKKYLNNIAPGDTAAVEKMLFTKHIMYNGSILKPILKKFLKQPYNQ